MGQLESLERVISELQHNFPNANISIIRVSQSGGRSRQDFVQHYRAMGQSEPSCQLTHHSRSLLDSKVHRQTSDPASPAEIYLKSLGRAEIRSVRIRNFTDTPSVEITVPRGSAGERMRIEQWIISRGLVITKKEAGAMVPSWKILEPMYIANSAGYSASASALSTAPPDAGILTPPNTIVKPSTEIKCKNDGLIVECSHKRGYRLTLPPSAGTRAQQGSTLQVVAGSTQGRGDEIKASTSIAKGPCSEHAKKMVSARQTHFDSKSATNISFEARSEEKYSAESVMSGRTEWLRYLRFYPATTLRYPIEAISCDAASYQSAVVEVFPDLNWDVDFKIGFRVSREIISDRMKARVKYDHNDPAFTLEASLTLSADGQSKSWGADLEFEQHADSVLKILPIFKQLISKTSLFFDKIGVFDSIGADEVWVESKFGYKGEWGYKELYGNPLVGYGHRHAIDFSPLLGAGGRVDVLTGLISLFKGFGDIVNRIRKQARKGFGAEGTRLQADLSVWFGVEGAFGGTVTIEKLAEQAQCNLTGEVRGELQFSLEGVISGELEVFIVKFSLIGSLGAESGFGGKFLVGGDVSGAYFEGDLHWNGLVMKGVFHVGAALGTSSERPERSKKEAGGEGGEEETWTIWDEESLRTPRYYFIENKP